MPLGRVKWLLTVRLGCATFSSATMFSDKKPRKALSELEHLVMAEVWRRGAITAEEMCLALAGRHPMKESTARTVLSRLEEKGYVTHRVEGRTNIYRGMEAPHNVAAKAVRQIVERLCGGSVEQLLVGMVDNHVVDEQELQRMAQRIARRKSREGE